MINTWVSGIPVQYLSWHAARRACDKFLPNSMLGPLDEYQDWEHFYDFQKKSNAMLKECESGGRYLHWLGYRFKNHKHIKLRKVLEFFFSGVLKFQRFLQISYILERINHYLLISFVQNNQILKQEISVWFLILAWSPMYLFMILTVKAKPGSGLRVLLASCQAPSKTTATLWPGGSAPDPSLTLSMR